jgi:hypothetical protein
MDRIAWIIGVILIIVSGNAVAWWFGAFDSNEPPELITIPTADLPGTTDDNAAKAIRALFDEIEQRRGMQGYNLSSEMRENPAAYLADVPAIERAAMIEHCDWGIPREWSMELPHVSAVNGFSYVLRHAATSRREAGDLDGATRSLVAALRLGRHTASGWSLVEKSTAMRLIAAACDDAADLAWRDAITPAHLDTLERELAWLEAPDAMAIRVAIREEARFVARAMRTGALARENYGSGFGGETTKGPGALRALWLAPELEAAGDALSAAWGTPDLARIAKEVDEHAHKTMGRHAFFVPNARSLLERHEAMERSRRDALSIIAERRAELAKAAQRQPAEAAPH